METHTHSKIERKYENERHFVKWILDIGNRKCNDQKEETVLISSDMLLQTNTFNELISWLYKDLNCQTNYATYFKDRAILAPKNVQVHLINSIALQQMQGDIKEYKSANSITHQDTNSYLYTIEYLNNLIFRKRISTS